MLGFNLTPSPSSYRVTSEFTSFKRSTKAFSLKKPSLNFHKSGYLTARRSNDCLASTSTHSIPSTPVPVPRTGSPHNDDVICISREHTFDPDSSSPDEPQPTSISPYATSSSSSSSSTSSSYHLPSELDDQMLTPIGEVSDEHDPRRGSQLSMLSSWMDNHLQELDLYYDEDGIYEIEIVTTGDCFLSRRDSFILPSGEALRSYQNPPVVPTKQLSRDSRLSRPLPCTPLTNLQSRRVRPLPPPPYPSW